MTPDHLVELYGDKIPYRDSSNREMFAQFVIHLQYACGRDEQLRTSLCTDPEDYVGDDDDPGPEFAFARALVGAKRLDDFGLDLWFGIQSRDADALSPCLAELCQKLFRGLTPKGERYARLEGFAQRYPHYCERLYAVLPSEVSARLWLRQVKDTNHYHKQIMQQCPVAFEELPAHFDGKEKAIFILALAQGAGSWEFLLPALETQPPLRKALADELVNKLNKNDLHGSLPGFERVIESCLLEILDKARPSYHLLPPYLVGRNNLLSALHRFDPDKSCNIKMNTLFVLKAIGSPEADAWHWEWFKQAPTTERLGNLPERWENFPVEEFFSLVATHPRLVHALSQSPRLAAIATLTPDRTISLLMLRWEEVARHSIQLYPSRDPEGRSRRIDFEISDQCHLDYSDLFYGREDLLSALPSPTIEILGLVGTPATLSQAAELFSKLDIEGQIQELSYLLGSPRNYRWLQPIVEQHPGLVRLFFEDGDRWFSRSAAPVQFFLEIVSDVTLFPLAFTAFAKSYLCPDSVWLDFVRRVAPEEDPLAITAELTKTENPSAGEQIICGAFKVTLQEFLDRAQYLEAANFIRKHEEIISKLPISQDVIFGLNSCCDSILSIKENIDKFEKYGVQFNDIRKNLDDNFSRFIEDLVKKVKTIFSELIYTRKDMVDNDNFKLLDSLKPVDRVCYARDIIALYERRSRVPGTPDIGLADQIIRVGADRIWEKVERFAGAEGLGHAALRIAVGAEYPSRLCLEEELIKIFSWPPAASDNRTFKLLDRLDDDLLPALLRDGISTLVKAEGNPWDANSDLSRLLRTIYPDYPQVWARAILRALDDHESLTLEWVRALCVCLALLREPLGSKVPLKLKELASHQRYLPIQETLQRQAVQFNRENLKKGQARRNEQKVRDVKQYLAKTSRMAANVN